MKRTALSRASTLKRGTRLRPIGKRGAANREALDAVRSLVLARDKHTCQRCLLPYCKPLDLHHRRSRAQGGAHTPANLVTLGRPCHEAVTTMVASDWRDWIVTRKAVLA